MTVEAMGATIKKTIWRLDIANEEKLISLATESRRC